MRSMLARVGPTFGPQIAVRPRTAGVVKLPETRVRVIAAQEAGLAAGLAAGAGLIDDVREAQERANRKLLIGGAVVVGLGLLAYFATRKRSRKNPVISNGDRRFFAQPDAAVKYLNEGFSVVGKTSSSRRRRAKK